MNGIDRWGTFLGNVLLPHSDLAHPVNFPYLFPFQCQFQSHFRAGCIENHFDNIFRIKMRAILKTFISAAAEHKI